MEGMTLDEIRDLPPLWQALQEIKRPPRKKLGRRPRFDFDPDDSPADTDTADKALAISIGMALELHYPNHPWAVEVEHSQGIAKIGIPLLLGMLDWYVIKLRDLASDPGMRLVKEAGGHILERFRIPRSNVDFAALHNAMSKVDLAKQRRGIVPE